MSLVIQYDDSLIRGGGGGVLWSLENQVRILGGGGGGCSPAMVVVSSSQVVSQICLQAARHVFFVCTKRAKQPIKQ